MTITDIYAKRGRPSPGVLRYDLPGPLRVQIAGIVYEAMTLPEHPLASTIQEVRDQLYGFLVYSLAHELGRVSLTRGGDEPQAQVAVFVEREPPELVLSLLDTLFSLLLKQPLGYTFAGALVQAQEELNHRFREHGVGYRIETFKAVRIGSDLLHEKAVRPAMAVLREPHFAGADEEFKKALGHYRHGEYEDAITECHKALESTLKVICGQRGWPFDPDKATASQLLNIVFGEGLIPSYLQDQFTGLRNVLTGISTTRNRSGGHGTGAKPRNVPEHLAAYVVHQTAAAILFLAESEKQLH